MQSVHGDLIITRKERQYTIKLRDISIMFRNVLQSSRIEELGGVFATDLVKHQQY